MKRLTSLVLSFVMALAFLLTPLLTASSHAATKYYNVTGGQLVFDTVKGCITGYKGNPTSIVIPAKINGVKVKSIGLGAFIGCQTLTSVTITNGLTFIGERVFWDCKNLVSVDIPESVTSIGNWFAIYCNKLKAINVSPNNKTYTTQDGVLFNKAKTLLKRFPGGKGASYDIPASVQTISIGAFYGCPSITDVIIPNGVTNIGNEAFANSYNLGNIHLPDSVTTLGYSVFKATNAEEITVGANNKAFTSVDGVLYNKAKTSLIAYPGARHGSYAIPEGVTSISDTAFSSARYLTDVYIPKSVKQIGSSAFAYAAYLEEAYFYGDAPNVGQDVFMVTAPNFKVFYLAGKKGFKNPWNNCKAEVFASDFLPPEGLPDLAVTDISWTPDKPVKGDQVTFTVTVKNQGPIQVDAETINSIFIYVEGQPVTAANTNKTPIKPGESLILSADSDYFGKSTWTAKTGTYKITAQGCLKMPESRVRNNTYETTLTLAPEATGSVATSDTFNLRANANYDIEIVPGINWVPANSLGKTVFDNAQIAELAKKSPEEKQASITNLYEAIQLFQISNFKYQRDNVRMQEGVINWEHHKPGYDAVRTNEGCCASDASWLSYILKNDYDEVGYIAFSNSDSSGHIYNYIKEGEYYYIIDLEQYESCDQYKYYTAPETGKLEDFISKGSLMGNLVKVKSLTDYVTYLRKTMSNAPGLFITYTGDPALPTDGVRVSYDKGLTITLEMNFPKGSAITILFDDPNDNMSLVYSEPPKLTVDWSKNPTAEIVPQTDF